jgi:hypothetical protein
LLKKRRKGKIEIIIGKRKVKEKNKRILEFPKIVKIILPFF